MNTIKKALIAMILLACSINAQTWKEIGFNLSDGDSVSHNTKITFTNKNIGWLFTRFNHGFNPNEQRYANLYRTTDGGISWRTIISTDDIGPYSPVFFSMEPDFFWMINSDYIGADNSYLLFTPDGGDTWDSTVIIENSGYGFSVLYFFNENRGITFYDHSIITTDGGMNWERKGEISFPLDVYFYNDKLGWAVGWHPFSNDVNYIVKTTNGGETWEYLDYLIPAFFIAENGIEFLDSLKGFVIGETLNKTNDGGKNWNSDYSVYGYDIGFFDNKYGWIGSAGQILGTSDGGETWKAQLDTMKNFSFKKIIVLKKDKVAFALGLNSQNGKATLLKADLSNITDVEDSYQPITEYSLLNNYPNPFNPVTKIKYTIPQESNVALKVYNILGKEVASLVNEEKPAGIYEVEFNGSNLSSGVYIYRIQAGKFSDSKKFILMK